MFDKVIKDYRAEFKEQKDAFFQTYLGNAPTKTMDDGTTVKRIG